MSLGKMTEIWYSQAEYINQFSITTYFKTKQPYQLFGRTSQISSVTNSIRIHFTGSITLPSSPPNFKDFTTLSLERGTLFNNQKGISSNLNEWRLKKLNCLKSRADLQRWQQVIFCKSKSSHKSFPCKSKSSHKSFPCKSKSSHKSFGQTSSQVTSHLVQTQVKSQVSLSKYKSSRTLFLPLPS